MNHKVVAAIEHFAMLKQGDRVVLGLSGGADSVALLDFLLHNSVKWSLTVWACHINHRLRGEESLRDERFVRELCEKRGVRLFCFTVDIAALAAASRRSVEEEARAYRYARFSELSQEYGAKIATAHTLSDNVETVLFRLSRGTGIEGLCGIPPVRGVFIRPLLEVSRAEVEAYCNERALLYVTDSSNLTDSCARNILRHHVTPRLREINGAAEQNIGELIKMAHCEQDYIREQALRALARARRQEPERESYQSSAFLQAHPALCARMIKELLALGGFSARRGRIENIQKLLKSGGGALELRAGRALVLLEGRLHFTERRPIEREQSVFEVQDKGQVVLGGKTAAFRCVDYELFKNNENNSLTPLKNAIDYDKINKIAVVRTRREGDRFSHPSRNWSKSLKKLFHEYGLSKEERERRLVCADLAGILWVEGFGADRRAAVSEETSRVLFIMTAGAQDEGE